MHHKQGRRRRGQLIGRQIANHDDEPIRDDVASLNGPAGLADILELEILLLEPAPRRSLDRDKLRGERVPVLQTRIGNLSARQIPVRQDRVDRLRRPHPLLRQPIQAKRPAARGQLDLFLDLKILRESFELHTLRLPAVGDDGSGPSSACE